MMMDEARLALILAGIVFVVTGVLFFLLKYQLNHVYHAWFVALLGGAATLYELLFSVRAYTKAHFWSDQIAENVMYLFLAIALIALVAFGGWMKTINQESKPKLVVVNKPPSDQEIAPSTDDKQTSEK